MKLHHKIMSLAIVAVVAGFTVVAFAADEKEKSLTLSDVPQKVKDTLKQYAADSEVKTVEKGDQDGTTVYEFDIEQGAKKFELTLSPKGKFIGTEEEIELSAMPDAAQKSLNAQATGGKIVSCEKAVDAKKNTTYEGVIEKDGKKTEVAVDADGKVVSTEAVTEGKD